MVVVVVDVAVVMAVAALRFAVVDVVVAALADARKRCQAVSE